MAPRLSRPAKIFLAVLSLAGAYIGATLFFDATAGAAAGVGGSSPPIRRRCTSSSTTAGRRATRRQWRCPCATSTSTATRRWCSATKPANPANGTDDCALTVELTVHASVALPSAVTNTSCGLPTSLKRDGRGGGRRRLLRRRPERRPPCGEHDAQLVISVAPRSCDEHCGWFWLWFPCRCHAAAMLGDESPTLTTRVR